MFTSEHWDICYTRKRRVRVRVFISGVDSRYPHAPRAMAHPLISINHSIRRHRRTVLPDHFQHHPSCRCMYNGIFVHQPVPMYLGIVSLTRDPSTTSEGYVKIRVESIPLSRLVFICTAPHKVCTYVSLCWLRRWNPKVMFDWD